MTIDIYSNICSYVFIYGHEQEAVKYAILFICRLSTEMYFDFLNWKMFVVQLISQL